MCVTETHSCVWQSLIHVCDITAQRWRCCLLLQLHPHSPTSIHPTFTSCNGTRLCMARRLATHTNESTVTKKYQHALCAGPNTMDSGTSHEGCSYVTQSQPMCRSDAVGRQSQPAPPPAAPLVGTRSLWRAVAASPRRQMCCCPGVTQSPPCDPTSISPTGLPTQQAVLRHPPSNSCLYPPHSTTAGTWSPTVRWHAQGRQTCLFACPMTCCARLRQSREYPRPDGLLQTAPRIFACLAISKLLVRQIFPLSNRPNNYCRHACLMYPALPTRCAWEEGGRRAEGTTEAKNGARSGQVLVL